MSEQYKIVKLGGLNVEDVESLYYKIPNYLKRVLVADLDGCIRNGAHRIHLLPTKEEIDATGDKPNLAFTRFNEQSHLDTPVQSVIDMVNLMWENGYYVIVLTSCTHSPHTLETLLAQLNDWEVGYDAVVMRGKDNHLFPVDFKQQFIYDSGLDMFEGDKYALDDCPENCDMFRENGFTALQVENWSRFNK